MNSDSNQPPAASGQAAPAPASYTPGYAGVKLAMILSGLALLIAGCAFLRTPLRLLCFGGHAIAEATRVIKSKGGAADQSLTDDVQVKAATESQDRSWTFFNEFRFETAAGDIVVIRPDTGSQLKPLYPLLDADGLPTSVLVCYDRGRPRLALFPGIVSTWFVPGGLAALGLLCSVTGALLWAAARKPIPLPRMPDHSTAPAQ